MNPQNFRKFEEIFQSALDRSGAERAAFLEKECAGDAELRAEIENFIKGYEEEENFFESPTQIMENRSAEFGAMFFVKIFLPIIALIAVGWVAYYFFSHITFTP